MAKRASRGLIPMNPAAHGIPRPATAAEALTGGPAAGLTVAAMVAEAAIDLAHRLKSCGGSGRARQGWIILLPALLDGSGLASQTQETVHVFHRF